MQTTISVEQDGKLVSWSDKLKGDIKSESGKSSEPATESFVASSEQSNPENTSDSTTEQF